MRDPREVQLAWFVVEFLQTMVDLICEHYQEDFREDDTKENEKRNSDEPWNF